MDLGEYKKKRDFKKTHEPSGDRLIPNSPKDIFVIQKHDARNLHYDFRLAHNGVLKSWAVPKGVPLKSGVKRLAIEVEDHPLAYANFEGTIPVGEYGAGTVEIYDKGHYQNIKVDEEGKLIPLSKCFKNGQLEILLEGKRYKGTYALIRMKDNQWLILKMKTKKSTV